MSGHNKWSQIKNKKAAEDSKRSKLFSMLVRAISMEARAAGGDRNHPRLRAAIEKARAANMPTENIERAISKGSGVGDAQYEEVLYEAYGPGGTALIIVGMTDNKNRTAAEIRHLLTSHGASFANPGSAQWAFTHTGDEWIADTETPLREDELSSLENIIDALDEHPDVKSVFSNASHS